MEGPKPPPPPQKGSEDSEGREMDERLNGEGLRKKLFILCIYVWGAPLLFFGRGDFPSLPSYSAASLFQERRSKI